MTSIIKVDQIQKVDGSAFAFGKVLQIATGYNNTEYYGTTTGVWNDTFSFSINDVEASSTLLIEMDPAGLMENIGAVVYAVFKGSTELGRSQHNGSGNGGWRTPPTMVVCTDASPSAGTNTYTVKLWSTGPSWYLNYDYPTNYYPRTHWKITEIAG